MDGQKGPQTTSGYLDVPSKGRSVSVAGRAAGDGTSVSRQAAKGDTHSTHYDTLPGSNTAMRSGSEPQQGNVRGYSYTTTAGGRSVMNGNSRPNGGDPTIKRIS